MRDVARRHGVGHASVDVHRYLSYALEAHLGGLLRAGFRMQRVRDDLGRRAPGAQPVPGMAADPRRHVAAMERAEREAAEAAEKAETDALLAVRFLDAVSRLCTSSNQYIED